MSQMALCVRFTLRDGAGEAFDELVREAVEGVLEHEPVPLVYPCSEVEGAPNQRLFFELYADRATFEEHGRQPPRPSLPQPERTVRREDGDRPPAAVRRKVPCRGRIARFNPVPTVCLGGDAKRTRAQGVTPPGPAPL
ncbi:putative quinol monooxygenase [Streptomyces antnestii]|uniref:putative quinol monooxygenase n=1 Tax=Streptomyces antnestii TaxID=2494256 RepID=UPI0032AEC4A9